MSELASANREGESMGGDRGALFPVKIKSGENFSLPAGRGRQPKDKEERTSLSRSRKRCFPALWTKVQYYGSPTKPLIGGIGSLSR